MLNPNCIIEADRIGSCRRGFAPILLSFLAISATSGSTRIFANEVTLVAGGSVWKYLDNGSNQGSAWRDPAYGDAGWASGPAQLGYGDGDEATVVGYGPNPSNRYITTYFRHSFTVTDPDAYKSLRLSILRDDGAVVYLNGVEIFRTNMPSGAISHTTPASSGVSGAAESTFHQSQLGAELLVPGGNVLAVEIHQSAPTSSDISFDLILIGSDEPPPLVVPGSQWKYRDNGSDQATAWRESAFNDASWPAGPAQLGYGDGDEATVVSYGPNASNKYITTYFRRAFSVADPMLYADGLELGVLRDDGVVVYLNGTEVYRKGMPAGAVLYNTLANETVGFELEGVFNFTVADPSLLVTGTNVIAAEIHQRSPDSSDISFDLTLRGASTDSAQVVRGPYLQSASPTSIIIRWRTNLPSYGRVRYGAAPGMLTAFVDETAATNDHEVLLSGLSPQMQYFYSIGTAGQTLAGDDADHFFVTPPPTGTAQPARIWVLGDAGTATGDQIAVRDAYYDFSANLHTDLWVMLGDNAYVDGTDGQYQAAVFDMYSAMLRKSPLWPALGNHDAHSADSPSASGVYFDIFTLPQSAEAGGLPSGSEAYYSFDYGNMHIICLDSEDTDRSTGGEMMSWLEDDLAAANQTWTICFWHHPPYSKGSHDSDDPSDSGGRLLDMRSIALPILEAGGVDLVLTGHSHSYERSYLLDGHYGASTSLTPAMILDDGDGRVHGDGAYVKPTLESGSHEGAVYVVAGSSGQTSGGTLDHPAMFLSLDALGSLVLDVESNRLDARFIDDAGTVQDCFTLVKSIPSIRADLNCDGAINVFDIDPFVLALLDEPAYAAAYPSCGIQNADINGDSSRDGLDISHLIDELFSGECP